MPTEVDEPTSRSGVSYHPRLLLFDIMQWAGISLPMLIPFHPMGIWPDYLPSAAITGVFLLMRGRHHQKAYHAQQLPLEEHGEQRQQRSSLSYKSLFLLVAFGAIALFLGALGIEQGLSAQDEDEDTKWQVQLCSVLLSGMGVLLGTRVFFWQKNRVPLSTSHVSTAIIRMRSPTTSSLSDQRGERERLLNLGDQSDEKSYSTFDH